MVSLDTFRIWGLCCFIVGMGPKEKKCRMTLCEESQRGQEGVFPVSYQEMQALGVSAGEAVLDSQLQSLDREKHQTNGKEILPFFCSCTTCQ